MRKSRLISLLFIAQVLSSCSSLDFDKKTMLISMAVGTVSGAALGAALDKKGGMNKDQSLGMGAAVGATAGALFVSGFGNESKVIDTSFVDSILKNRTKNKKGEASLLSSTQILPPDLPSEVKKMLKAPRIKIQKTSWEEVDGALHEPHRVFEYVEGGLE